MTTAPNPRAITVVGIIAESAELTRKDFEVGEDEPPVIDTSMIASEEDGVVNVKLALAHKTADMRIRVDVVGQYSIEDFPPEGSTDELVAVVGEYVVPALYPFAVEAFRNTAIRLPGQQPAVPFYAPVARVTPAD